MPDGPGLGGAGSTAVFERLRALLGERFSTGLAIRDHHSHGEGLPTVGMPDGVVFPTTNEEVAAIVAICRDAVVPIVGFGAGTSLEGHVAAVHGGICVDFSTMNRILEVSPEALDCRVQAGVTWQQLNADVRSQGLFFPVDPGAEASLGGMAATRASGTMAVRYGTMRRQRAGADRITADGRDHPHRRRARKSAAGLRPHPAVRRREGTLGLITELQLRLYGMPEAISAAVCLRHLRGGHRAVVPTIQFGVPLARIELMDAVQMRACIRYAAFDEFEPERRHFSSNSTAAAGVEEQVGPCRRVSPRSTAGRVSPGQTRPEDRTRLWTGAPRYLLRGMACVRAPRAGRPTSACRSLPGRLCRGDQGRYHRHGLIAPIVGHVGDGNFHLLPLIDVDDPVEFRGVMEFVDRMVERAIAMGAPAPASTASACTDAICSISSTARRWR